MTFFIVGLLVLLGMHSVSIIAPAARDRWAAALGAGAWRGLYSLVSLAGFVALVYGYGLARQLPVVLYVPPLWLHYVAFALMLPVFPLLLASGLPGRIQSMVKHPMITAVKAWAVADRISLKRRVPRPTRMAPPSRWNDAFAVVAGLLLYGLMVHWLHRLLIGVSPL